MAGTPLSITLVLVLGLLSLTTLALPTNGSGLLGSICEWDNDVFPVLYHEYWESSCPAKFHLTPSGACEDDLKEPTGDNLKQDRDCSSFCQMRTTFSYAQEQPFVRAPGCQGPQACTLSQSIHQGYAIKLKTSISFGMKKILSIGINGGYNWKGGTSQGFKASVTLKTRDDCGYWTFIPFAKDTCGSYTEKHLYWNREREGCIEVQTIANQCAYEVVHFKGNDQFANINTIRGVAVFVWVDCDTYEPLPNDQQAPALSHPGVRLPRDTPQMEGYKMLWKASMSGATLAAAADDGAVCNPNKHVCTSDCVDALNDIYANPARPVLIPAKDAKRDTGVEIAGLPGVKCHVYLSYDEDWDEDCQVPLLEAAAAAQAILDSPCNDGDAVSGKHAVRGKGNCQSTVWLLREGEDPWGIYPP
ncbi:hypothetical protein A1O7_06131 [Cladophialophora yegresii CBS 114405]|uniref:Uncharacterized protein n=1 Tax=Cladophialophora yegresii CBS 114405 TaxID=1182544 RepID=W9VSH4_9EURO|nr:uncharacterized protein A1O7_06131 [Cladophialophora yegresii CBS 114405]EXJ58702.1 hypothetical protein A1O7_06131 [Cladophialophora yegresii CBS 114405]